MLALNHYHLRTLLHSMDAATLAHITHMCQLPRVPGLTGKQLVERLLEKIPPQRLYDHIVAARFGLLGINDLLHQLVDGIPYDQVPINRPRMDKIDPQSVTLVSQRGAEWAFTMRGHDVRLNLQRQHLTCDCHHFQFASRYGAICKHIAMGFRIIPPVYARTALIDILIQRELTPHQLTWTLAAL